MSFSPRSSLASLRAFTLVELLTVIIIIAILMGLLLPAVNQVRIQANKTKAKTEAIALVSAVKGFYAEYGKYPSDPKSTPPTTDQVIGPNNGGLIDVLRATQVNPSSWNTGTIGSATPPQNSRGVVYLDVPLVKNPAIPKGGIATAAANTNGIAVAVGDYVDPFGLGYFIALDYNYNNFIDTDTLAVFPWTDVKTRYTGTGISGGAMAWSYGPDNQPGTQGNNILNADSTKNIPAADDIVTFQ